MTKDEAEKVFWGWIRDYTVSYIDRHSDVTASSVDAKQLKGVTVAHLANVSKSREALRSLLLGEDQG